MTDLDLDAIKARADAATQGPWAEMSGTVAYPFGSCTCGTGGTVQGHESGCGWDLLVEVAEETTPDSVFIAHAREDVPVLLAEVERLSGECVHKRNNDQAQEDLTNAQMELNEARDEIERLRVSAGFDVDDKPLPLDHWYNAYLREGQKVARVRALIERESGLVGALVYVADLRAALDEQASAAPESTGT